MGEEVELSIQGEVAFVQLRRPEKGNALRGPMFDALRKVALRLQDTPPRYLVLCGEGEDFSRGLLLDPSDPLITMLEPMVRSRDAYRIQETVTRLRGTFDALARLPCPVIAAIEGRCHGAGLELALIADMRVASSSASFCMPGARHGMISGLGGIVRLTMALGPARAQDFILVGRSMDAQTALSVGLVSHVCDPGAARAAALDLVAELRNTNGTARLQALLAIRAIKRKLAEDLFDHEGQAAARTLLAGDWQNIASGAAIDGEEPSW